VFWTYLEVARAVLLWLLWPLLIAYSHRMLTSFLGEWRATNAHLAGLKRQLGFIGERLEGLGQHVGRIQR